MVMPDKVLRSGTKHLKQISAERRAGEMLKESKIKPGNPQLSHDVIIVPRLDELGITPMQSHRWQLEAEIPRPPEQCHVCKSNTWWRRGNDWLCGVCHPDPRVIN